MAFIYIAGPAGSGKSALAKSLHEQGFDAFDEDDPGIGSAHELASGKPVKIPNVDNRDPDWFSRHEWRLLEDAKARLADLATRQNVYLFGNSVPHNEVAGMFDKVLYLGLDDETVSKRVASRPDNDFGHSEEEIQQILSRKHELDEKYKNLGAQEIDATQPLEEVTQAILRLTVNH